MAPPALGPSGEDAGDGSLSTAAGGTCRSRWDPLPGEGCWAARKFCARGCEREQCPKSLGRWKLLQLEGPDLQANVAAAAARPLSLLPGSGAEKASLWHWGQALRINPNHFPADIVPRGRAGSWQCRRSCPRRTAAVPPSPASLPNAHLLHPHAKYPIPQLVWRAHPGQAGHSSHEQLSCALWHPSKGVCPGGGHCHLTGGHLEPKGDSNMLSDAQDPAESSEELLALL